MQPISYARHQFPAEVIRHATWLYLRFTLSYRDVEDLLAKRGLEASYETVRRWVLKFGPALRCAPSSRPSPFELTLASRRDGGSPSTASRGTSGARSIMKARSSTS